MCDGLFGKWKEKERREGMWWGGMNGVYLPWGFGQRRVLDTLGLRGCLRR